MRLRTRISILFFIGIFTAGSTALGYYYFYVYSPPLMAAERFMAAMEAGDEEALRRSVVMGVGLDSSKLREPEESDLQVLLSGPFQRGRILDQRRREGKTRDFDYLVYREPDGQVYALVVTRIGEAYRVVIPEKAMSTRRRYLWEYAWTN
jgi:hypothetical protein